MAKVADCVERMIQFKQRCPDAEFDLKPSLFTVRVPGRDEPFRALSLCNLRDKLERWAAEEIMAGLLFGAGPARHQGTTDDRLPAGLPPTTPTGFDGHADEHPGHYPGRRHARGRARHHGAGQTEGCSRTRSFASAALSGLVSRQSRLTLILF